METSNASAISFDTVSDMPSMVIDPCGTTSARMSRGASTVMRTAFWSRSSRRMRPVPSMCPETMCPPKRPSAAMARSRFTGLPARRLPRLDCESVCGMTSAQKPVGERSVTVRHTPITAMLSPSCVPPSTRLARMRRLPARPGAGTCSTRPTSSTIPVNMRCPLPARLAHLRSARPRPGGHRA